MTGPTTLPGRPGALDRTVEGLPSDAATRLRLAARVLALGIQMTLVLALVRAFQLENRTFYDMLVLAAVGFPIHALLPLPLRRPFFVVLSFAGIAVAFGAAQGAWLAAAGLVLIGVCHLPLSWRVRIGLLLGVGALLASARAGWLDSPVGSAVWPILGSMFMFRLALYVYALRHEKAQPRWSSTLAYFFMLPNVAFPLFPVVDYTTFTRTHYDEDALGIYETGMQWIVRGLVQLILYRVVYLYMASDPTALASLGDLVSFLLGTFLLYLRVSGSFHVIVGLLHLFGFRLPETHHLYFLAPSFTDFWRRINIYWKDYMMKLVYFPSFFRLRRYGGTAALVVATIIVFFATWILHSYQWFWLRGGFPLTAQDGLFWGLLGVLVVFNALREAKRGRGRSKKARQRWSLSLGLRTLATFTVICVLWSLWSAESVVEWLFMWRVAARPDTGDLLLVGGLVVAGVAFAGYPWGAWGIARASQGPRPFHMQPSVRSIAVLVALVLLTRTDLYSDRAPVLAAGVASVQTPVLNARDAELQHRGYYEKLDNPGRVSAQLWGTVGDPPDGWEGPAEIGLLNARDDFLGRDLNASMRTTLNGDPISTNRWGMRDRDYPRAKPPGTVRIALLGQSHVLGTFVLDDETFENVLEDRLNRERRADDPTYEVLNFAVTNHSLTQELALLEDRVLDFEPDLVIVTIPSRGRQRSVEHLVQLLSNGTEVPYEDLRALLARGGLDADMVEGLPVPFAPLRAAAATLGVDTRMPYTEAEARARDLSLEITAWTLARIASVSSARGARPVLLALDNANEAPVEPMPELELARKAGFLVLDLFDVYDRSGVPLDDLRVTAWDNHPNAEGHRVIADRLHQDLTAYQDRLGLSLPERN